MLGVAGQQCYVRLHGAKSMTGFKLCATAHNNMQQSLQTDATCNIQLYELTFLNLTMMSIKTQSGY